MTPNITEIIADTHKLFSDILCLSVTTYWPSCHAHISPVAPAPAGRDRGLQRHFLPAHWLLTFLTCKKRANEVSTTATRCPGRTGSQPCRSSCVGMPRSRQTSKSLRVCSSMRLSAIGGGVQYRYRAVDRGQRAVGVLAESRWPGLPRRLKASPSCSKLITAEETERLRSRRPPSNPSAPAAARRVPGLRPPAASPAEQQQFLGQSGFAGVEMRDDCKGAPAGNLVGQGPHQWL
jgi:hypothetical protein